MKNKTLLIGCGGSGITTLCRFNEMLAGNASCRNDIWEGISYLILDTEVKKMEARYVGNFYRLERNRDKRLVLRIPPNTLEKAKRYRIDIYPVETFGKEGKPLSLTTTIRHSYTFNNLSEIGPQE